MTPYELLTENDLNTIYNYITYIGEGTLERSSLSTFLSSWNEAKSQLLPIFGNSLILSRAITYNKPLGLIKEEINDILYRYRIRLLNNLSNTIKAYLLDKGYDYNITENALCRVEDLWFVENLIDNTFNCLLYKEDEKPIDIPTPQGNRIRIAKGCKPMRIIGKLVRAFLPDAEPVYEAFRIEVSQALNTSHLEGNLCLSIHPMDYITMSDNDCDWQSCMAWSRGNGEYKKGTLEMLGSAYCVVAYLQANTPYQFRYSGSACATNSWNNKKWRQLIFVHPAFICGNRNYPYEAEGVEAIALDWLRQLAMNANFSEYQEEPLTLSVRRDNRIPGVEKPVYIELTMDDMYNDLSENNYYISKNFVDYCKNYYWGERFTFRLNLSGEARCINCGQVIYNAPDPCLLICEDCVQGYTCDCCGDYRLNEDPYYTNSSGECFCSYCVNNSEVIECDICDDLYPRDDTFYYDVVADDEPVSNVCACGHCVNSRAFNRLFGHPNGNGDLEVENISEEGIETLKYHGKDCGITA